MRERLAETQSAACLLLAAVGLLLLAAAGAAPASAVPRAGSDWQHALKVVTDLRADPPSQPLVLLMGDSLARECTVSDATWSRAIKHYGEAGIVTRNLGSRNQTFDHSTALVTRLPAKPAIVYISVDPGRFASGRSTPITTLDTALAAKHWQHHYKDEDMLSWSQKQALVRAWVRSSYPVFRTRYLSNLLRLDVLLQACGRRHVHAVLLDMPLNMDVIGSAFDVAIDTYRHGCKSLAALYDVPYVNLGGRAHLVNTDFYDHAHMIGPGRVKFQKMLARKTVTLLREYGLR